LSGRFQQVVGILFLGDARVIIETRVPQLGTLGEVNQGSLMSVAKGEFQRIDPKSMMPRCSPRQLESGGVEGELAQQQSCLVGVGEPPVVAEAGHASVGEFTVHDAK